jgi:hypothetical protein
MGSWKSVISADSKNDSAGVGTGGGMYYNGENVGDQAATPYIQLQ